MHLRPVVRRLTILWIVAVVLAATMTISASYHARLVTGACWLALAGCRSMRFTSSSTCGHSVIRLPRPALR